MEIVKCSIWLSYYGEILVRQLGHKGSYLIHSGQYCLVFITEGNNEFACMAVISNEHMSRPVCGTGYASDLGSEAVAAITGGIYSRDWCWRQRDGLVIDFFIVSRYYIDHLPCMVE
jgi:hypothetical protein